MKVGFTSISSDQQNSFHLATGLSALMRLPIVSGASVQNNVRYHSIRHHCCSGDVKLAYWHVLSVKKEAHFAANFQTKAIVKTL